MISILDVYTLWYLIGYIFTFWLFTRRNFYNFFYMISLDHLRRARTLKDYQRRCSKTRYYLNRIGYIRVGLLSLMWPLVLLGSVVPLWLDKEGFKAKITRESKLTIN